MAIPYPSFDGNAFDTFVQETMEAHPTLGLTILVLKEEGIWSRSYGYSDLVEHVPVAPDTLFCIDSITKTFTAAAASHLVESPEAPGVSWKTPLSKLIPEDFVLASGTVLGDWATNNVTLEDALSHRTGMPRHDWVMDNGDPSVQEIVQAMRHLPMKYELREQFGYNNIMYAAIVHAIQARTGRTFGELLREEILEPLEMKSTYLSANEARSDLRGRKDLRLARCHLWNPRTETFWPVPWDDIPPTRGGEGMISSALDLSNWMQHLMFPVGKTSSLSSRTVREMRTPRVIQKQAIEGPFLGSLTYGLGLHLGIYHGRSIAYHGGAGHGSMSMMIMVPPQQGKSASCGILVLQNSRSKAREIISWHLLDAFLEVPLEQRRKFTVSATVVANNHESTGERKEAKSSESRMSLADREGLYVHPAYHSIKISASPSSQQLCLADDKPWNGNQLFLHSGSPKSYLGRFAVLSHIAKEQWHARQSVGIASPATSTTRDLEFVSEEDGRIKGLNYQVEKAMGDDMAYFKKVA